MNESLRFLAVLPAAGAEVDYEAGWEVEFEEAD